MVFFFNFIFLFVTGSRSTKSQGWLASCNSNHFRLVFALDKLFLCTCTLIVIYSIHDIHIHMV